MKGYEIKLNNNIILNINVLYKKCLCYESWMRFNFKNRCYNDISEIQRQSLVMVLR